MIHCTKYGNEPYDDYELTQKRMALAAMNRDWQLSTWFMTVVVISVMPYGSWADREAP
jgi:hypothetical protein